jgi:hypothetical protein
MSDVYELSTSRKYLNNEGKPRAERQFVVVGAATEGDVVALLGTTLPGEYENYPNDGALPYDMLAFDYSITKDPSAVSTWQVTMRYRAEIGAAQAFNNPTSPLLEPSEVGYRTARLSMQAEFRDLWRDFASVTALQAVASGDYSVTDIGGSSIDAGGIPLSTLVYKQEFSILITDQFLPDAQAIATQIGTRNASTFLNYPSGSVVFAGCNCETIPEVGRNSIEYRFIYDQAYHQIQYPVKGNNGSPILASATVGTILKGSAEKVYYKQPFKYTSNFNNLSQYFTGL